MNILRTLFLFALVAVPIRAQFPQIANSILGPDSLLYGVKNVLGGVLAADKVHNHCLQKTICSEFSDEVVEMTEVEDPVKRTVYHVPRVVQRRGRLRWVGDLVAKGVKKAADILNVNPYNARRRQGGPPPTLAAKAVEFVVANWEKIPLQQIFHVLDFGVDITGGMERKGNVYPYAKSAALGYGYGHKKEEEFDGVCSQVAPDCGGWWGHLETVNNYEGGALSRKAAEEGGNAITRAGGDIDPSDPFVWNTMKAEHVLVPKVFLCKAGLFLEQLNSKMGGDGVTKERFGPEDFQKTCDPKHLGKKVTDAHEAVAAAAGGDGGFDINDIEIIDARDQETTVSPLFDYQEGFEELPILVFEGLPSPTTDQSEEELVESVLRLVNIPQTSVRTALRLPLRTRGKSIVLVEMDTEEHKKEVLEEKDNLRLFRSPLVQVGIRRARYRELWKFVRQLMVVKELEKEDNLEALADKEEEKETPAPPLAIQDEVVNLEAPGDENEEEDDDTTIIEAHRDGQKESPRARKPRIASSWR